jgi:hypothetical protein
MIYSPCVWIEDQIMNIRNKYSRIADFVLKIDLNSRPGGNLLGELITSNFLNSGIGGIIEKKAVNRGDLVEKSPVDLIFVEPTAQEDGEEVSAGPGEISDSRRGLGHVQVGLEKEIGRRGECGGGLRGGKSRGKTAQEKDVDQDHAYKDRSP